MLNRLYALLVDGGTQDGVTVQPIGLLKALQLMWKMQLRLTSGSTFFDFATGLKSLCRLSIGAELYELDFVEGISTVSSETIGSVDCDMVDIALDLSKMFESPCTDTGEGSVVWWLVDFDYPINVCFFSAALCQVLLMSLLFLCLRLRLTPSMAHLMWH